MSKFFSASYDIVNSSDDESLYYSDDERYLSQLEAAKSKSGIFTSKDSDEESDSGDETMSESDEDEKPAANGKSSGFLKSGSDEESEDDDEDEDEDDDSEWGSDSDDEESSDDDTAPKGRSYFLKSDFLKSSGAGSDSEDEDEKKVVKSAKDKYLDEIAAFADSIENLSMVEDWVSIATEFEKLNRLAMKYGQYHIIVPRFYIKTISILEDAILNYSKESNEKKLNASESKSLNILKQKIKKEVKTYSTEVELYKQDPEAYESGSHEILITKEDDSDNDEDGNVVSKENLISLVKNVIETRGKKGVDLKAHLKTLNSLLKITDSTYEKILLLNLIISLRFELFTKSQFMPSDEWNISLNDISKLLDILDDDQSFVITENAPANEDISTPPKVNEEGKYLIVGSITAFVERLYDEFTSHLLYIDPNSSEYITLLQDDAKLYSLIVRSQIYLTRIIPSSNYNTLEGDQLSRIILKRVESIYYKPIKLIMLSELNFWNSYPSTFENFELLSKINSSEQTDALNIIQANKLIDELCAHIYNYSNGLSSPVYRKKAALMQAYYYSTSNQFYRSRDILLLTHVQTTIHTSEPGVQVLFNRTISQLGLAAFRAGLVEEAQSILNEIVTSTHTRELLGQGRIFFSKNGSANSSDAASNEKGKFVPFHQHINIELLDAVYYISSLFVEVPLMAVQSYQGSTPGAIAISNAEQLQLQNQNSKKNSSRSFKRILEYTERQYFQGPSEETRDSVFEAYNHLVKFNWKSASKILCDLRVWAMMPGTAVINSDNKTGLELLNEMLIKLCKVESLKVWTYVNAGVILNYSIRKLSKRFELEESQIVNILSGLIYREEIRASLEITNGLTSIIFEKREDSMNEIIRGLTEKVNSILERNEKLSLGGYQIVMKKK